MGDWDRSTCPFCGCCHREFLYAFPPTVLLNRFVAKARADGVRAILVTPLAVSAPYWSKLLRASVVPNADGCIRLRRQAAAQLDAPLLGHGDPRPLTRSRGFTPPDTLRGPGRSRATRSLS